MEQTVYLDILILINLFINYLLLKMTAKFSLPYIKKRRLFAGAFVGAVFSLVIFAPPMSMFVLNCVKLVFALIIVAVTFGIKDVKRFFRATGVFLTCNFLFAGALIAFFILFTPKGMLVNNTVLYFDMSAMTLIIYASIVYSIISLIQLFTKKRGADNIRYSAEIAYAGRRTIINAIIDTGCDVTEVFTNTPVCICEYLAIKDIIPQALQELIQSSFSSISKVARSEYGKNLRLIPFKDVSGTGMMCAIRPDKFTLIQGLNHIEVEEVYIAFTNRNLSDGDYQCLINPDVLEYNSAKKGVSNYVSYKNNKRKDHYADTANKN